MRLRFSSKGTQITYTTVHVQVDKWTATYILYTQNFKSFIVTRDADICVL